LHKVRRDAPGAPPGGQGELATGTTEGNPPLGSSLQALSGLESAQDEALSPATGELDSMSSSMEDQPTPPGGQDHQPETGSPLRESVGSAGERIQVIIEAAEKAAAGIIEDADAQARRYIDASRQRADALADERVRVMSDLTDTLIRQAELVRRQSDELLAALDSARGELASRIGQELSAGAPTAIGQRPASLGDQPPAAPQGSRSPHLQPVESEAPGLRAVQPAADPKPPPPEPPPAPQGAGTTPPAFPPRSVRPPNPPTGGQSPSDGARLLAAQMAVAGSSREEIEIRLRDEFGIQDAGPILDGILGPG
jgi:vacuolar-type H+-ATPase subunit H